MNWESDAAAQANAEFSLRGIPFVAVFDGSGKLVGTVSGTDIEKIRAAVEEALGS